MTFPIDAVYLDARVMRGSAFGLSDDAEVNESDSGVIEAHPRLPRPRRAWDCSWQRKESSNAVEDMFDLRGNSRGFLLIPKRYRDYIATDQVLGTGDGSTTVFRLKHTVTDGVLSRTRLILRPLSPYTGYTGATVKLDTTPLLTGFSVNYSTARITFDVAPVLGVSVKSSFQFAWAARFKSDRIETVVNHENNQEMHRVAVEEVFEDEV